MDPKDRVLGKARGKIVEELAIRMILDDISEEGTIALPQSWVNDADGLRRQIVQWIDEEAATERGEMNRRAR
jgi:hypothetical protein